MTPALARLAAEVRALHVRMAALVDKLDNLAAAAAEERPASHRAVRTQPTHTAGKAGAQARR